MINRAKDVHYGQVLNYVDLSFCIQSSVKVC